MSAPLSTSQFSYGKTEQFDELERGSRAQEVRCLLNTFLFEFSYECLRL